MVSKRNGLYKFGILILFLFILLLGQSSSVFRGEVTFYQEDPVNNTSDIDSTPNTGNQGGSTINDSQTLDGTYETLTESDSSLSI